MSTRLFVGNLAFHVTEDLLKQYVARSGDVRQVDLIIDRVSGRPRGFAFVEMATDEEAQKAVTEFNEYELGGRALAVNEARPKPEYSGGGGGGFGGGRGRGGSGGGGGGGSRGREPRW